jgi:hypothetical protein
MTVIWRCVRETDRDFCPIVLIEAPDGSDRAVVGPYLILHGIHPTFLWKPGEAFRDTTDLELPFAPALSRSGHGLPPGLTIALVERERAPLIAKQFEREQNGRQE